MHKIFGLCLLCLLGCVSLIRAQEPAELSSLIRFKGEKTTCAMYTDECRVNILVKKSDAAITVDDLSSTNHKTFKIRAEDAIKLCEEEASFNLTDSKHSCSFKQFNLSESQDPNDYSIYTIRLSPGIVGFEYLVFFANQSKQTKHLIIITEPRRLIDILFDWYIRLFQLTISFLMGVLLDTNALRQLVKMPVPVAVCIRFFFYYF